MGWNGMGRDKSTRRWEVNQYRQTHNTDKTQTDKTRIKDEGTNDEQSAILSCGLICFLLSTFSLCLTLLSHYSLTLSLLFSTLSLSSLPLALLGVWATKAR